MRLLLIIITSVFLFYSTSCKHYLDDNQVDMTALPPPPPENDSVCFNTQILPLITSNCAQEGCHNTGSHSADLVLNNYNSISKLAKKRKLMKSVLDTDPSDRMPYRLPPLDQADIDLLNKWIGEGTLNRICTPQVCDTINVTYTNHIGPILKIYCKACHNSSNLNGNVNLDNYTDVKVHTLAGKLICTVRGINCSLMPKGGVSIGECNIRKIEIWANSNCPQ